MGGPGKRKLLARIVLDRYSEDTSNHPNDGAS